MFNENLKALRKQKGYTQETLAIKLNVVRQTISKWEKGLSVPDVEMLDNIAQALDTSVSQLLGSEHIESADTKSVTAEQLATIAEQLASSNQRKKKIWKIIKIIIIINLAIIFVACVVTVLGMTGFINIRSSNDNLHHQYVCTLDDNIYTYDVILDDNENIVEIYSDDNIPFDIEKYDNPQKLSDEIFEYYQSNGGTVEDIVACW